MVRFICMFLVVIFYSCLKNSEENDQEEQFLENPELVGGKWKLFEYYVDPGDGSGEYMKIKSDRIIEFFESNTIRSNGDLCTLSLEVGDFANASYILEDNIDEYSFNNYILPENCEFEDYRVYFHMDGNYLILNHPCIEGCGQKYGKLSN